MAKTDARRCLAIVRLRDDSTLDRVRNDAPKIMALLTKLATAHEPVFHSNNGTLFGVFMQIAVSGIIVQAEFEKSTATRDGDSLLVFEAGEPIAGTSGFSRAWTWLQHH